MEIRNEDSSLFIMGKVSIVMPTHNSGNHIKESIDSVLSQSYQDFELLVIDDGSTDNTIDILTEYKDFDDRIYVFIKNNNCGAAVSRNIGLKKAEGQYIAFLDSDDVWKKCKLEKQLEFMKKTGSCFSFTAYQIINESGESLNRDVDLSSKAEVDYKDMLAKKATMGCSTVILDQSTIGKIQMPLIRTGQDYALWLKILKQGYQAQCLKQVLTLYRIVPTSISRNKYKKAKRQWEIYRSLEKLNLVNSIRYFVSYAWRAVFRT